MKKLIIFLMALFVMPAKSWADEAADLKNHVWSQYLEEKEQAVLRNFFEFSRQQAEKEGSLELPKGEKELVRFMREGFDGMIKELVPPASGVEYSDFSENGIKGLWMMPPKADPDKLLIYFHGGGYVVGDAASSRAVAGYLARQAGITCFSLDYPLAPEHPFPAAPNNALAAYKMLLDKGYKAQNIVLAGDSAGANLVLATLINIREEKLPRPAAAFLLSPWVDLTHSGASHQLKKNVDTTEDVLFLESLAAMYCGGTDLKDPRISPVFADLKDLPPLLVHVGSHETLLDDSLTIVRNAALADVPVQLEVWPSYEHVFQLFIAQSEGARKSLKNAAAFLNEAMAKSLLRDVE